MSEFRKNAMDAIRDAEATDRLDREARLLGIARAWLELAEHEDRVRRLEAELTEAVRSDASSSKH